MVQNKIGFNTNVSTLASFIHRWLCFKFTFQFISTFLTPAAYATVSLVKTCLHYSVLCSIGNSLKRVGEEVLATGGSSLTEVGKVSETEQLGESMI